jgi:hypothetical protein
MQHIYQIIQQAKVELCNEQQLHALVFSQVPYIPILSTLSNEKEHLHHAVIMELSREIPLGLSIAALWIHNQHWWEKSQHPQSEAEIHLLQRRFTIEKMDWKWSMMNPQTFLNRTSQIIESFEKDESTSFVSDRYQNLPPLEYPAIILKDESNEFDAIFFTPRNICLYSWGNNIATSEIPEPESIVGKPNFRLM